MLIYMDKDMGESTAAEDTLEGENGTTEGENFAQRQQRARLLPSEARKRRGRQGPLLHPTQAGSAASARLDLN